MIPLPDWLLEVLIRSPPWLTIVMLPPRAPVIPMARVGASPVMIGLVFRGFDAQAETAGSDGVIVIDFAIARIAQWQVILA